MTKVNPKVVPTIHAEKAAFVIYGNGGNMTAEEWERTVQWESHGWAPTRAGALRMADPDGAIFGSRDAGWRVCRRRSAEAIEEAYREAEAAVYAIPKSP